MTSRDNIEAARPPGAQEGLPALVVEPDRHLQDAWRVACEWCGNSRTEICIREYLRGMIFSPGTWFVLEREFRVDMREASASVARDSDAGARSEATSPVVSAKLRALFNQAAARALGSGSGEMTTRNVVEALWDMPGEERHCAIFPDYVERKAEQAARAAQVAKASEAGQIVAVALPRQLEALAADIRQLRELASPPAEREAEGARLLAMQQMLQELNLALSDAPRLDNRVDRLSNSFGAVQDRLRELGVQNSAIAAALERQQSSASEQRTMIEAQSTAISELDRKSLDWRWRPSWWPRRRVSGGKGRAEPGPSGGGPGSPQ